MCNAGSFTLLVLSFSFKIKMKFFNFKLRIPIKEQQFDHALAEEQQPKE